MENNSLQNEQKVHTYKNVISGILIGCLIGIFIGFLHRTGIFTISLLDTIFSISIPFHEILSGILLGSILGSIIGWLLAIFSTKNTSISPREIHTDKRNVTLPIKEEQLDIAKKWIQTGDVKIYKEVFSENKNFTIPIEHENLVIEKKSLETSSQNKDAPKEIIKIPLSEEHVEFSKHRVALEDVSIYKKQIEDIKHIEETLKKEKSNVKVSGSAKVTNK
ncbi:MULTISPECIES: YsnF/AvaK domain-containing protein [Clostridium]|uniref:YsnF/AvaK domain-containing protein n=1 Tax=Clostridium TaxID=1485 RepID=UPI000AB97142|nr:MULTISPECIES: YsnF/AvaK domain-containing protein [Clostridium]